MNLGGAGDWVPKSLRLSPFPVSNQPASSLDLWLFDACAHRRPHEPLRTASPPAEDFLAPTPDRPLSRSPSTAVLSWPDRVPQREDPGDPEIYRESVSK